MKQVFPILVLVCSAWSYGWQSPQNAAQQGSPQAASTPSIATEDENSRKARSVVEQGIQALGGQAYLTIRDREVQGRGYSFHHGVATGGGGVFWGFFEYPDKERVELTKERDVAELYVGNKAWELTYRGPRAIEQKDLDDYLRRRHYSLDTVLRTWVNDPGVVFLYEGFAVAAQHPATQVTLINAKNESVTLYFDNDSHWPVKKSFSWRDPVDRQKNLEEEVYENYRQVSGVMVPFNVTRYFNGDMAGQRFLNSVTINQGLDEAMFDPRSKYNPIKAEEKNEKKKR